MPIVYSMPKVIVNTNGNNKQTSGPTVFASTKKDNSAVSGSDLQGGSTSWNEDSNWKGARDACASFNIDTYCPRACKDLGKANCDALKECDESIKDVRDAEKIREESLDFWNHNCSDFTLGIGGWPYEISLKKPVKGNLPPGLITLKNKCLVALRRIANNTTQGYSPPWTPYPAVGIGNKRPFPKVPTENGNIHTENWRKAKICFGKGGSMQTRLNITNNCLRQHPPGPPSPGNPCNPTNPTPTPTSTTTVTTSTPTPTTTVTTSTPTPTPSPSSFGTECWTYSRTVSFTQATLVKTCVSNGIADCPGLYPDTGPNQIGPFGIQIGTVYMVWKGEISC